MRKLLIAAGAVFALSLALAGISFADNGPHGGYSSTTDACAGCHRAHTAKGAYLMVEGNAENGQFCFSCHDGTGAYTDVEDGILNAALDPSLVISDHTTLTGTIGVANGLSLNGAPLKGGGFVNAKMNTDYSAGGAASRPVTSKHSYDGTAQTAWGFGALNSGFGVAGVNLTCVDCHDPHGSAGENNQPTYRILRGLKGTGSASETLFVAVNSGVTTTAKAVTDVTDIPGDKLYTISNTVSGNYFQRNTYGVKVNDNGLYENTGAQISAWCSGCHTRYLALPGAYKDATQGGTRPAGGDADFMYQHASTGEYAFSSYSGTWGYKPGCLTCHVAHGSAAHTTGNYDQNLASPNPLDTSTVGVSNTKLLRLDGRGVCQGCHLK